MSIKVKKGNEWITLAGVKGSPGESAYEHAKKGGFAGTEEEFNEKLANAGNNIIIDDVPTSGSKNAVSSSGVYSSIEEVKNQIENIAPEDLSGYLTKEEANETFASKGEYQDKLVEDETPLFNVTSSDIDGVAIVKYGGTLDLGNLKGQDGKDGEDGKDGSDGSDGVDGISSFTSFVFARAIDQPIAPQGGTFEEPSPEGDFTDSIPEGTDPVWMSKCTFYSNVDYSTNKAQWSDPVMMADTPEFEVMYSSSETQPEIPENFDNSEEWWTLANTAGWTDNPETSPIWMATSKKSFGVWTTWTISKIKGEKGSMGEQGPEGPQGPAGNDGNTVSTTIYYANHNAELELGYIVPENVGSDLSVLTNAGWTTDFNEVFTNINPDNSKYYSMIVSIYYVDGNVEHCTLHEVESHTTTINQGRDGKMVYPAGLYSDFVKAYKDGTRTIDYKASSTSAPYVKDGDKYYIYNVENSWLEFIDSIYATTDEVPDSLTGVASYESYWIEMESFSATYAEILIADNGTVGDAVFNSGYMLSMMGKKRTEESYEREESDDYHLFNTYTSDASDSEKTINNSKHIFKPNAVIDFKTGFAMFGAGDTVLSNNGLSSFKSINVGGFTSIDANSFSSIAGGSLISSDSSGVNIKSKENNGISINSSGINIVESNSETLLRDYIINVISSYVKDETTISTHYAAIETTTWDNEELSYTFNFNGQAYPKSFFEDIDMTVSREFDSTGIVTIPIDVVYPYMSYEQRYNPLTNEIIKQNEKLLTDGSTSNASEFDITVTSSSDITAMYSMGTISITRTDSNGEATIDVYVKPKYLSTQAEIHVTISVS